MNKVFFINLLSVTALAAFLVGCEPEENVPPPHA
jgi:hypothetical protein